MYCYKLYDEIVEEKKAKGVPKAKVKKRTKYERL